MNLLKKNHELLISNKNKVSKTQTTTLKTIVFLSFALILFGCLGCSKEDNPSNDEPSGELVETPGTITENDFESFEGELGIVLDARELARKGYKPAEVSITVDANNGDFSQTVAIDEVSFMGQLKIPMEGLSDEAIEELKSGVAITAAYKDADGAMIYEEPIFTKSFQSNPSPRMANTTSLLETEENQILKFRSGTSYYIQRMNADGSPDTGSFTTTSNSDLGDVISASGGTQFNGNEDNRAFTFDSVPNVPNTFLIKHNASQRYVRYATVTTTAPNNSASFFGMKLTQNTDREQIEGASDYHNYQFTFEKQDNGTYLIKNTVGQAVKQAPSYGLTFDDTINNTANGGSTITAEDRSWRIVTASVDWNFTSIGTTFLPPVLPKPETSLAFNSILTNCGSGTLSQTVGTTTTETQEISVGFEETLTASTSNTFDVNVSLDVEFSTTLFGTGSTVNAGIDTSYGHSWSSTETNSNWESTHNGTTTEITSSRTVTVPSGSASLVYDVVQFYPETKVNFVQELRIDATDNGQLSGDEIRTLFYLTNFNGVITAVEPTSIKVTLRGTMTLDKIIDSESSVQDVPANCN